ncbi:MAG: CotH kinase family protein [Sedimentibacter sp.]
MKWIKSLVAILVLIAVLVIANNLPNNFTDVFFTNSDTSVDSVIFPHDEVVDVNIQIDEDVYDDMIANATEEEVVMADITYNGYTFSDIGIRPKGNSSLRDVAKTDGDRFSFKIDFNYYLEDQDFYGITKINLNNLFSDPSMMAEYLSYEMLDDLDEVSSRTTYVALSINGEYYGLYLAVEQVNSSFLIDNFGDDEGELYKPEMGTGSDLAYISDNGLDYTGLYPENSDEYDNEHIAELIKAIEDGSDLDSVFNVDSFLKYLAMSTMTIHSDSYQGGMYHNYYLYNNDGIFQWIPWDLNMTFNGFTASGLTDAEATEYLIDEPVTGSMSKYPLIEAIFKNEEYVEQYHEYLKILSEGYLEEDNFNEKVLSVYNMINDYVETDTSSFYSYDEFKTALFTDEGNNLSILGFMEKRVENVEKQLSGDIPSTNNGEGNSGSSSAGGMGQRGNRMNVAEGDNATVAVTEGVEGEMAAPPEGVVGEIPERPVFAEGEMPEIPEGVAGEMQAPPEVAEGEIQAQTEGVDGARPQRPTQANGGMQNSPQGMQDDVEDKMVTENAVGDMTSTTNIVIFSIMLVLTIGASVYLWRKH